jgi:mannose-6-phosphate isomerase-like protein (cupin superfamily)
VKVARPLELVRFDALARSKSTVYQSPGLLVGVDGFEPGQVHAAHVHAQQEKVWWILAGRGTVEVAGERRVVEAGELVVIPAAVEHAIAADQGERLVVAVILAPGPTGSCG